MYLNEGMNFLGFLGGVKTGYSIHKNFFRILTYGPISQNCREIALNGV